MVHSIGLVLATLLLLMSTSAASATEIGFQTLSIPNGAQAPLKGGVWYPTDASASPHPLSSFTQTVALNAPVAGHNLPLVVISHGSGGWSGGHHDTALALARAGFVVAAVTHRGDSFDDHRQAAELWIRPVQLKRLTDCMVALWADHARIDVNRIGVFGFSAGGFTALVAAGGVPDFAQLVPYRQAHPETVTCTMLRDSPGTMERLIRFPPSGWEHDPRVRAAVVAAPAVGFAFGKQGLEGVRIPVQLWRAEFDHVLPYPDYADAVRLALPQPPDYHVVPNADHYDFLPPCSAALASEAPEICRSRPGFDRAAFHAQFNQEVVTFFQRALGETVPGSARVHGREG